MTKKNVFQTNQTPLTCRRSWRAMFPQLLYEDEHQHHKRIDDTASQLQHPVTTSDPTQFFTRFHQLNKNCMVNQVCPSGISEIVRNQGLNSDVQNMIRILAVPKTLQTKSTLTVFFSKAPRNRKELDFQVLNDVLYRLFCDNRQHNLSSKCNSSRN